MVAEDALLPGSSNSHGTAPPKRQRRHQMKKKRTQWQGPEIPNDIPKLSDVMKDVSVEEFAGNVVVAPPLQKNGTDDVASSNGKRLEQHHEMRQQNTSPECIEIQDSRFIIKKEMSLGEQDIMFRHRHKRASRRPATRVDPTLIGRLLF